MTKSIIPRGFAIIAILILSTTSTSSQTMIEISEVGRIDDFIYGFDVNNERIYFADYSKRELGITSFSEISNETSGGVITQYPVGSGEFAYDTVIHENFVYLVTSGSPSGQLYIFDVNDENDPILQSTLGLSFSASKVEYFDSHVYILSEFYVMVVDVSDPENPVELDYFLPLTNPIDIEFYNSQIIVIDEYRGFTILDISQPESPVEISEFTYESNIRFKDGDIQSNHLYLVSSGEGIFEFELEEDGMYSQMSSSMNSLEFSGNCIERNQHIILLCQDEIQIISIEDQSPEILTSIDQGHVTEIQITKSYIVIAASIDGLVVYSHNIQFEEDSTNSGLSYDYSFAVFPVVILPIIVLKKRNGI